jgi:hypothetical protein
MQRNLSGTALAMRYGGKAINTYFEGVIKMSTAASTDAATAAAGTVAPDPKDNGSLRQLPDSPQIYLILNGLRRWIPDMTTIGNLFVSGTTAKSDPNLGDIEEGAPLTSGTVLAQASGSDPIYLVTNSKKMWIPSMDILNSYHFDLGKVQVVAPILLNSIPSGPDVQGPTS